MLLLHISKYLCKAHISDDNMTGFVKENVLRLEISVDNVDGVEVAESSEDLGDVEQADLQGEGRVAAEVGEKFTTSNVGTEQVEIVLVSSVPG